MSLQLSAFIVATIIATSFVQVQTESYVPRHIFRGKCSRLASTSAIISREGCYNNITVPSCTGACTSYEYPVIFNNMKAAKNGANVDGNRIEPLVQKCQCCKPVDYAYIPVVDYPLHCPDGSIKNITMKTRWIYSCDCQSCGV